MSGNVVLLAILAVVGCTPSRSLPPIPEVDEIRVRGLTEEEIARVKDRAVILQVVSVANDFADGWRVPWYGPPVAKTNLTFYSAGQPLADLGLGRNFITRTHDNFYSREVPERVIQDLREKLHLENPYAE